PAHVRAVAVGPLDVLGYVPVLVPVLVLLGDAEVHERAIPEVSKAHAVRNGNARAGTKPLRAPEHRADAHVRRPLLGGDAVVLARAHGQLGQPVSLGELTQLPKIRARGLRIARG